MRCSAEKNTSFNATNEMTAPVCQTRARQASANAWLLAALLTLLVWIPLLIVNNYSELKYISSVMKEILQDDWAMTIPKHFVRKQPS